MPETPDYFKLYFEEKFNSVAEVLTLILKQTEKTNSRVNHLEDDIERIEGNIVKHGKECPAIPDIKAIKENLGEYNWVKKHPKTSLMILTGAMIALLGMTGFAFIDNFVKNAIKSKIEMFSYKNGTADYDSLNVKPR